MHMIKLYVMFEMSLLGAEWISMYMTMGYISSAVAG